jgi:hypothetical protein
LDSVLPVIEAGQAELIDGLFGIGDTLLVEPEPGHTRGHVVLKLDDHSEKAVFCGDAMHHPLQVYAPHWNSSFCELPEEDASDTPPNPRSLCRIPCLALPRAFRRPTCCSDRALMRRIAQPT